MKVTSFKNQSQIFSIVTYDILILLALMYKLYAMNINKEIDQLIN
jgi:hypothetical protein